MYAKLIRVPRLGPEIRSYRAQQRQKGTKVEDEIKLKMSAQK